MDGSGTEAEPGAFSPGVVMLTDPSVTVIPPPPVLAGPLLPVLPVVLPVFPLFPGLVLFPFLAPPVLAGALLPPPPPPPPNSDPMAYAWLVRTKIRMTASIDLLIFPSIPNIVLIAPGENHLSKLGATGKELHWASREQKICRGNA
jgi:hypothetical protein